MGPPARASDARSIGGGSGTRTTWCRFRSPRQDPMAVFLAEVGDAGAGGFEDRQAKQAQHGDQGEVVAVSGLAGRSEQGLELQVREPGVGDSVGTAGRRTCSAGEFSRTPSTTQVR